MKNILFCLLLISSSCYSQDSNLVTGNSYVPVSSFEKDGKVWVTYQPKNAQVQIFDPLEKYYTCDGLLMMIIDTSYSKGIYRLTFGKEWVEVAANRPHGDSGFGFHRHIMFMIMAACFDNQYVYCKCGERFPIVKKNF